MPDGPSAKLVGRIPEGMGCGKACGALLRCSPSATKLIVMKGAHAPGKQTVCAFAEVVERFGSDTCCVSWLKTYKKRTPLCLDMICIAAVVTDACFEKKLYEERNRANERILIVGGGVTAARLWHGAQGRLDAQV